MAYLAFLAGSTHDNGGALLLEYWESLDEDRVVYECPEACGWAGKAYTHANRVFRKTVAGSIYRWNGARWSHEPKEDGR